MENNKYTEVYDEIYHNLWSVSLGQWGGKQTLYKGAKRYGKFLLSESDRYEAASKTDEAAIERRGLVPPKSLMKAWAYNVLEDCNYHRITPPIELVHAIYRLMDCSHLSGGRRLEDKRQELKQLKRNSPGIGVREAARIIKVHPATISRWNREKRPYHNFREVYDRDEMSLIHKKLRELSNSIKFYPKWWLSPFGRKPSSK